MKENDKSLKDSLPEISEGKPSCFTIDGLEVIVHYDEKGPSLEECLREYLQSQSDTNGGWEFDSLNRK